MMACLATLIQLIVVRYTRTERRTRDLSVVGAGITAGAVRACSTSVVTGLTHKVSLHRVGCIRTLRVTKSIHLIVVGIGIITSSRPQIPISHIIILASLRGGEGNIRKCKIKLNIIPKSKRP